MMFNFWSVHFLGLLLALDASLIVVVKANKVSEVQVASDLTLASDGSEAGSRSALPVPTHSTGSPILHHSIKSDIDISSKVAPSTTLAPHSSASIVDKTHISVTESSKAPTSHEAIKHSTEIIASSDKPSHVLSNKEENHSSKLRDFLKPICDSVDRIQSKQLSKIQSQFKQFMHVSPKLSTCFLDHYKFDLTTTPISGQNLKAICSSQTSTSELSNNSYESFLNCAKQHWSSFLDVEFDKTATGRINHIKEHQHSLNDSLELLEHDVEDVSLISGFINKYFDNDNKNVANPSSSDVKVLDIAITTPLPKLNDSPSSSAPAILSTTGAPNLMNDPNTFLVFLENSSTTALPTLTATLSTSSKPVTSVKDDTPIASNISIASKETKVEVKAEPATTVAPIKHLTTKSIAIDLSTIKPHLTSTHLSIASSTIKPDSSVSVNVDMAANKSSPTSVKPLISILTTKKVDTVKKIVKGVVDKISGKPSSGLPPTMKPVLKTMDSFEEILKKQEKEKQELELKLKMEREKFMKQLQRKQDEIDAQNAVKALQHQRDISSSHSDAKLHQLEHDRQMTIDPVGHTLKHQQYELNKQQKMFAGK